MHTPDRTFFPIDRRKFPSVNTQLRVKDPWVCSGLGNTRHKASVLGSQDLELKDFEALSVAIGVGASTRFNHHGVFACELRLRDMGR